MALGRAWSIGLVGLDGHVVEVEADLAAGIPAFVLIGLPDATMQEARDRVRAAVVNSGRAWPQRRITLALSPARAAEAGERVRPRDGGRGARRAEALPPRRAEGTVLLGELSLDGRVRPVPGVLPAAFTARGRASAARRAGRQPRRGALGARARRGGRRLASRRSAHLAGTGGAGAATGRSAPRAARLPPTQPDLADVLGQAQARRGLEVAAAGRAPRALPRPARRGQDDARRTPADDPAARSTPTRRWRSRRSTRWRGAARRPPLITLPPFRAPHHSASLPALVGGGSAASRGPARCRWRTAVMRYIT